MHLAQFLLAQFCASPQPISSTDCPVSFRQVLRASPLPKCSIWHLGSFHCTLLLASQPYRAPLPLGATSQPTADSLWSYGASKPRDSYWRVGTFISILSYLLEALNIPAHWFRRVANWLGCRISIPPWILFIAILCNFISCFSLLFRRLLLKFLI